jgi:hypothetical protein
MICAASSFIVRNLNVLTDVPPGHVSAERGAKSRFLTSEAVRNDIVDLFSGKAIF